MKVVLAGGSKEAEYLVGMFADGKNELIVINPSETVVETIGKRRKISVYHGDPWKKYCLEEAGAFDADVFVALCPVDTDNYASCIIAKRVFNAKKTICLVTNPANVDLYKSLGIDSVISSPYMLGQIIQEEASIENIMRTMSLENDKIKVIEAVVLSTYEICDKTLRDIRFPRYCSVAAIFRSPTVIIPNGDSMIQAKDTLLLVCAPSDEIKVKKFVQRTAEIKPNSFRSSTHTKHKEKVAKRIEKKAKASSSKKSES